MACFAALSLTWSLCERALHAQARSWSSAIAAIGPERSSWLRQRSASCCNGISSGGRLGLLPPHASRAAAARLFFAKIGQARLALGRACDGGSEPLAHNGVVGGSSPPEPTTHSVELGNLPLCAKSPRTGGLNHEVSEAKPRESLRRLSLVLRNSPARVVTSDHGLNDSPGPRSP